MAVQEWGSNFSRHPHQVRISWSALSGVQQTGFYLRSEGATVASAQAIAENVEDWVSTNFRTLLGSAYRILGIDVVDLVTRDGFSVSPANMMGTINQGGENYTPGFLCATVALKGERRTRYGQGRMFFPVTAEGHIDNNVLSVLGRTAIQGVVDSLAARYINGSFAGYQLVNVHGEIAPRAATPSSPARPAIPPQMHDVTSLRLNANITFLRSRKANVGS
ncbi:MAG TPA: hypothetical protein VEZ19_12990 [Rubrobacter sp.]|nr:hypothetical protein [Rubrobacter sp.]